MTFLRQPLARSPPSSSSATRSSHRSSPVSAAQRQGRKPTQWTRLDRDYETNRIHMQILFDDLAITTPALAA